MFVGAMSESHVYVLIDRFLVIVLAFLLHLPRNGEELIASLLRNLVVNDHSVRTESDTSRFRSFREISNVETEGLRVEP